MVSQKDVSLGEFLRYERELRGITIEQVASATKVGVRTLHALEADHYSELPAKPFIRGFVNSYCRFIGLDSKELLARFDDYINSKAGERPNREAGHSGYAFEKRDGEQQSRTLLLVAMFGFVVVGGIAIVFLKPSFHHQRASHMDKLRAAHGAGMELPLPDAKESVSTSSLIQYTQASTAIGGATSSLLSSPQSLLVQPPDLSKKVDGLDQVVPKVKLLETAPESAKPEIAKNDALRDTVKTIDNKGPVGLAAIPVHPTELLKEPVKEPVKEPIKEIAKESVKELVKEPAKVIEKKEIAKSIDEDEEPNAADPLDSGLTLKSSEIHHKVIFKVLADIWVRYKVDSRPVRKFIIRKGNSLVLRAKEGISFQVSNPKSLMFNYNSHGSRLMSSEKNHTLQQGNSLFAFPPKHSEKLESPFEGGGPLPKTADPSSE